MLELQPIDHVLAALAHPARRRILDLLMEQPGMTVKAVASHFDISRIAVMKHLATLEAVDLVLSEKVGRERRLYFNVMPLQEIYDRWTTKYASFWSGRMADVKARIEERTRAEQQRSA